MKKVKLKMNHKVVVAIAKGLQQLINDTPANSTPNKIHIALWTECYFVFLEKSVFHFTGEKKISLSVSRALGLSDGLLLMQTDTYLEVVYLQLMGEVEQQTT